MTTSEATRNATTLIQQNLECSQQLTDVVVKLATQAEGFLQYDRFKLIS